jgi:N-glycosylase/DNA lyase
MQAQKHGEYMKVIQENKNLIVRGIQDFDIEQTLECGQCFHFVKLDEKEYGLSARNRLLHIKQIGNELILYQTDKAEYESVWKTYFDMDRDYRMIKKQLLSVDNKLGDAIHTMQGVRILKQDFFEMLISFIISQNKQIPHIKKIVAELSEKYGTYLGQIAQHKFYTFPSAQQLSVATEEDLRQCKTGFRAPYICDAVEKINSGIITADFLQGTSIKECEEMLQRIKGVGSKVASCVMLFGLEKREAFPVDVWIKRIMEFLYFEGADTPKETIASFAKERFGAYGGYAQQYLFYYGKTMGLGTKNKKSRTKV